MCVCVCVHKLLDRVIHSFIIFQHSTMLHQYLVCDQVLTEACCVAVGMSFSGREFDEMSEEQQKEATRNAR